MSDMMEKSVACYREYWKIKHDHECGFNIRVENDFKVKIAQWGPSWAEFRRLEIRQAMKWSYCLFASTILVSYDP